MGRCLKSKSNPSSNRPEHCTVCKSCFWPYNMLLHFQEKHHDVPCSLIISERKRGDGIFEKDTKVGDFRGVRIFYAV